MIKTISLTVKYRDKRVLENIDLFIKPRTITCILGPNGAGKTTLLRAIAKLIKYHGSIYIDGFEVSKTPLKTIARLLSYVESIKTTEFLNMTVIDALITAQYPVSKGFFEKKDCFNKAFEVMDQLDLANYAYRKLSELSSGELQRVALAIGLVKNPEYLLFDEIDLHIDIGFKKKLIELLRKWSISKTIVLTTHDILFATITGEYFIVLNNGKTIYNGDRNGLIEKKELLEEVFNTRIIKLEYCGKPVLISMYI